MTLDAGIHHLGTEVSHLVVPLGILALGGVFDHTPTMSFAAGILSVLVFGNMRCQSPYYRWRVKDAGPPEVEE